MSDRLNRPSIVCNISKHNIYCTYFLLFRTKTDKQNWFSSFIYIRYQRLWWNCGNLFFFFATFGCLANKTPIVCASLFQWLRCGLSANFVHISSESAYRQTATVTLPLKLSRCHVSLRRGKQEHYTLCIIYLYFYFFWLFLVDAQKRF